MQIFNLFEQINEINLQSLRSSLVDLTEQLSSSEKVKPFQNIMLLIRDWLKPDDFDFGSSGGQEMIDEHCKEMELLEYVNQTYENVSCFLMPPPGDKAINEKDFDGSWSKLDEEFIKQLKFLVSVLLAPKNLIVKTINKKSLGANDIYNCVLQYANNKGDIPDAKSIYEATVLTHMQNVIDESMLVFNNSLHDNLNSLKSLEEIDELYEKAKKTACDVFESSKKMGTADQIASYNENLTRKLRDCFLRWKPKAFIQLKRSLEHNKLMERAEKQDKMLREMKENIAKDRLVQEENSKKSKRNAEDFVAKLLAEKKQTQKDQTQLQRSSEKQSNLQEEKKLRELKEENDRMNKAHDEALKLVADTKKAKKDAEEAIETLREKNDQLDQRQKELEQQAAEDREAQLIQEERICELTMEIERLENEAKEDKIQSAKEIKKAAKKLRKLKELLQEERDQAKKEKKKANWFKRHIFKTPNFLFCSADVSADFKFKTAGKPAAALLKMAL